MKFRVGVVGVSGYAGLELIKLIASHPAMEFAAAMDAAEVGEKPLADMHPRLRGISGLVTFPPEPSRIREPRAGYGISVYAGQSLLRPGSENVVAGHSRHRF